jgi:hypothetical protein
MQGEITHSSYSQVPRLAVRLVGTTMMTAASLLPAVSVCAEEDIEFVQEHLPEVAMDNRYATLPVWIGSAETAGGLTSNWQAGYNSTSAGALSISGPLLAAGMFRPLNERWDIGVFAFYDRLQLQADLEQRDLQTLFAPSTPIGRPVPAEFWGLDGTATDLGIGISVGWRRHEGFLGEHRWVGGVLWQRMSLQDYRFNYRILSGPQSELAGTIDFDADYAHVVPFVGLELPRHYGRWSTNAHALAAFPLPRRGVIGHITGPDFDIHGDTADAGNGKHFGDPSLTLGYTITYEPAHLSIDLGTLLTQGLLEQKVHRGIDRNLVLSFSVSW